MTEHGFALFDTDIGRCGIAWGARGIIGVQLPEAGEARTRARLVRRHPHAREAPPPADVRRVIDSIVSLLGGQASDLSAAALDMDGLPEFDRRVYEVARGIAPGATLSYGEIAARLANGGWRATSGKRSDETRSRSSCRAIACSPPAARRAASPPTAASPPSCACSRSNARAPAMPRRCSTAIGRSVSRSSRRRSAAADRGGVDASAAFVRGCQGCAGNPYMRSEGTAS